jgi:hypothetical protein
VRLIQFSGPFIRSILFGKSFSLITASVAIFERKLTSNLISGYDLGVIANVIISPDFLRVTKLDGSKDSDADYIGFIVSSFLLG